MGSDLMGYCVRYGQFCHSRYFLLVHSTNITNVHIFVLSDLPSSPRATLSMLDNESVLVVNLLSTNANFDTFLINLSFPLCTNFGMGWILGLYIQENI